MTLPSGLPRARRGDRRRTAVVASLAGLVVAAGLVGAVVRFASQRPEEVKLGQQVLRFDARRLADRIAAQSTPLLLKDPLSSGPGREVYVQHLGGDPAQGWLVVEAYAPGAPRRLDCLLAWEARSLSFRDPCGGGRYPADGEGLRTSPAEVDGEGRVVVDLRGPG